MKITVFTFLATTLLFQTQILAQYDKNALAVLDAMSSKYQSVEAFKASFAQNLKNDNAGIDETIAGQISVKGSKFVLDVAGLRVYNNGTDVYTYNPEIKEVTISEFDPEESEISLGNIYELYKEGFKYALISTESNGDRVVDLDPESRDKTYFKIRMTISAKNELKSFKIFERSGNQYLYTIQSFKSASLTNNFFTFDPAKYPNVEVIDFR